MNPRYPSPSPGAHFIIQNIKTYFSCHLMTSRTALHLEPENYGIVRPSGSSKIGSARAKTSSTRAYQKASAVKKRKIEYSPMTLIVIALDATRAESGRLHDKLRQQTALPVDISSPMESISHHSSVKSLQPDTVISLADPPSELRSIDPPLDDQLSLDFLALLYPQQLSPCMTTPASSQAQGSTPHHFQSYLPP
ncbi:hypothetical protein EV702DRAFT_1196277 [Suillus placidus]|uniref:Uncharacterized protein n=1 Tax=Suillus placidus TaxID=48579 RepID=A0A9P6ZYP8_9AGAM|nr:hypothetical protein EV702DRAFT_1196277 [Suillus placidus]